MNAFQLVALCVLTVLFLAVLCVPPKLVRTRAKVPDGAASIGPDGYMRAWVEDGRVSLVFRNMPWAAVRFDRRAVPQLVKWMQTIQEDA